MGPVLSVHWTRWDGDTCPKWIPVTIPTGPVSIDIGPNPDPYPNELLSKKIKESRINEL